MGGSGGGEAGIPPGGSIHAGTGGDPGRLGGGWVSGGVVGACAAPICGPGIGFPSGPGTGPPGTPGTIVGACTVVGCIPGVRESGGTSPAGERAGAPIGCVKVGWLLGDPPGGVSTRES